MAIDYERVVSIRATVAFPCLLTASRENKNKNNDDEDGRNAKRIRSSHII